MKRLLVYLLLVSGILLPIISVNALSDLNTYIGIEVASADPNSGKSYDPKEITIVKGTTVIWINKDTSGHSVVSGNPADTNVGRFFDSAFPLIRPGATFEHGFDEVGEFPYFCSVHPWMKGKVMVMEKEGSIKPLENNSEKPMVAPTDRGSLDVELSLSPFPVEPQQETKMHIRFLQKGKDTVQQHIDYKIFVEKDGIEVFRIPLTHTNPGEVTIPYSFTSTGNFMIGVDVEGILFQPIPKETAVFSVTVVPEFPVSVMFVTAAILALMLLIIRFKLVKTI